MKIILTTNIKKLGKVGDQVHVKTGFARNFLFPNKMALRDTKSNIQYFEKIKDEINIKENDKKQKAIDLIKYSGLGVTSSKLFLLFIILFPIKLMHVRR